MTIASVSYPTFWLKPNVIVAIDTSRIMTTAMNWYMNHAHELMLFASIPWSMYTIPLGLG
jgi:hypothetical protein